MKTFKPVSQVFLNRLTVRYWLNLVKNFNANVREENFFEVMLNRVSRDKALELLEAAFTAEELKAMTDGCGCRSRLDFSDGLDRIFQMVWNNERMREKCRGVLRSIGVQMLENIGSGRMEPLERRFREIRRVFKLSETEYEILLLTYVCNQTRFAWPARATAPELPLLYAMALDCPYGDVLEVMNGTGKLRKFCLLDEDWDFDCALLGFLNGSHAEAIVRQFYRKRDLSEALPWEFYGELAERDGRVLKAMLSANPRRCNILFYGAPGIGKTSFVHTLAKELGRSVFEIRQGDEDGKNMRSESRLAGVQVCNEQELPDESLMVVDEADELLRSTTQNIARAFRAAESEHAILFFDEIDGLVQDRADARASWEVSQVNELLQQMENFDGVMIAATNFCTNLDAAIMRRFTFKLEFDYLDDAGKRSFFERMFRTPLTEGELEELSELRNLAPGDFRTVRQELFYLGESQTNHDRIEALRAECLRKKDGEKRAPIGFAA